MAFKKGFEGNFNFPIDIKNKIATKPFVLYFNFFF